MKSTPCVLDTDLLEPFVRLVPISILGRQVHVPEGNRLLRCFQCLEPRGVSNGRFCWNGTCAASEFGYVLPGEAVERFARACSFEVVEGMAVTRLSEELWFALRGVLAEPASDDVDRG